MTLTMEALARTDLRVASELRDMALRAMERMQRQSLTLGRMTATAKVGAFLLDLEERMAGCEGKTLVLPMSRYDIADYLGISVETVSRTLTDFRRRGLIAFRGARRLTIVDRIGLEGDERREAIDISARDISARHCLPGWR